MTPRRKGATPLTRDRVVDEALALIDEQGLDACTMRRLGERMGVDGSSLYHHVPSQSALFDLVADRIMRAVPVPPPLAAGADPAEAVVRCVIGYFDAMTAHPRAARLLVERPLRSVAVGEPFERLLEALFAAGLTPTQALSANGVLGWFLIGAVQNHASQVLEAEYGADIDVERLTAMAAGLPNFTRLMAEATPVEFRADFVAGLRSLVRGLLEDAR